MMNSTQTFVADCSQPMESIVFNCGKLCFPSHITLKPLCYARWMVYDELHSIYKILLWYLDWLCIIMFDHAPIWILLQFKVQYDYALLDKKRLLIINNNYLKNAMFNSLILGRNSYALCSYETYMLQMAFCK